MRHLLDNEQPVAHKMAAEHIILAVLLKYGYLGIQELSEIIVVYTIHNIFL